MRLMGSHFVLGETIESALARARPHSSAASRYSFDMLGEGARTAADAERYFNSYAARSKPSAAPPTIGRCPIVPAFRSNSRRCIRVSRR